MHIGCSFIAYVLVNLFQKWKINCVKLLTANEIRYIIVRGLRNKQLWRCIILPSKKVDVLSLEGEIRNRGYTYYPRAIRMTMVFT